MVDKDVEWSCRSQQKSCDPWTMGWSLRFGARIQIDLGRVISLGAVLAVRSTSVQQMAMLPNRPSIQQDTS